MSTLRYPGKANTSVSTPNTDSMRAKYKIVYTLYAGGDDASWATDIASPESIPLPNGGTREVLVHQTLANEPGKVPFYPIQGTHFRQGVQAFLVSPRNSTFYNWQWILDSWCWANYNVEALQVEFVSNQGNQLPGSVEGVFLDQGMTQPGTPYHGGQSHNSFNFPAHKSTGRCDFNLRSGNASTPWKCHRRPNNGFDKDADFGILWWRTIGYNQAPNGKPYEVGTLTINLLVNFEGQVYYDVARLVGPWAAAGFPITGSGEVTEIAIDSASSGDTIIPPEAYDNLIRKGKQSRWHLVSRKADKGVLQVPRALLNNTKLLRQLRARHVNAVPSLFAGFFTYANPDLCINGVSLVKKLLRAGAIVDGCRALSTSGVIRAISGDSTQSMHGGIGHRGSSASPMDLPATALGLVELVTTTTIQPGESISVTIATTNAIACTHDAQPANLTVPQVAFGYDSAESLSSVEGLDQEIGGDSITVTDTESFVTRNAIYGAGIRRSTDSNGAFFMQCVNAVIGGVATAVKELVGTNSPTPVIDTSYDVPVEATFRQPIGVIPDGEAKDILGNYFPGFPLASRFGPMPYSTQSISQDVNMIKVNYSCATTSGGLVGVIADQAHPINGRIDSDVIVGLLCSRYSPADAPQDFVETAIFITPPLDGFKQSSGTGDVYQQQSAGGAMYAFEKNNGSTTYTKLSHFGVLQTVTPTAINFSVPWPSHLPTAGGTLAPLEAGTPVFFEVVRTNMTRFSLTFTSPYPSPTMFIAPQLTNGASDIVLTSASPESKIVTNCELGSPIENAPAFLYDVERSSIISGIVPSRSMPEE